MIAREERTDVWTANRVVALIIGIVFTLIGLAGFLVAPGMRQGSLFGFSVDLVHNLVHLVTGILGLIAAFSGWARRYNQIFGIIYLLLGLFGLIYPALYFGGRFLGVMHINAADHVLHWVVGVIAAGVGFFLADETERRSVSRDRII